MACTPTLRWLLLPLLGVGCGEDCAATARHEQAPTASSRLPSSSVAPTTGASAPVAPSASAPLPLPGSSPACPGDMALVAGDHCPLAQQICLERPRVLGAKGYEQCQRYAPAKCLSRERRALRFCMDRYEWPNHEGVKPRTLTSFPEAAKMCESIGKRLCTMHEWELACEGEDMKAHVYGNVRSPEICNFDRPYRERTFNYYPWERCMADEACKKEYDRLDQRLPAGSLPNCVSREGVYDLNGNVNEWVVRTDQRAPKRSGLKGGWWGPVRNRCRPMTTFHLEGDYGYEVGFRCCKDPG